MQMQSVSSTNIDSVGYDADTKTLRIAFNSGRTYDYYDVPGVVHRNLLSADSVGSYFRRNIKDSYSFSQRM